MESNRYYKFNDGFFTYYINVDTGEKKLYLDAGDIEVEPKLDDFYREGKCDKYRYSVL